MSASKPSTNPMPPTKSAQKPPEPADALVLFAKNLEEMRRWYRRRDSGHSHGVNVEAEIILGDVANALTLACQGKGWTPPEI
jgi:hypothetical protein